ncbi:hypothetical protein BDN70DRAFT_503354 [Pholiota conissans]|uniref:Uncharacterized protein n=1 Tax=Pholiota conissans TaxID=109636 RepID=A0A9P5YN02_9AGAR|nr:hypothetical protein BDN70DRAFT_503354 [Pholiota conissans]
MDHFLLSNMLLNALDPARAHLFRLEHILHSRTASAARPGVHRWIRVPPCRAKDNNADLGRYHDFSCYLNIDDFLPKAPSVHECAFLFDTQIALCYCLLQSQGCSLRFCFTFGAPRTAFLDLISTHAIPSTSSTSTIHVRR